MLGTGQRPLLESSADPCGGQQGAAEAHLPQVGVDVVDEAQGGAAVPERCEVRHSVADLDEQIGLADLPGEGGACTQIVAELAARRHDPVVPERRGTAADQGHLVAEGGEPLGQPVDQQLGAARGRIVQISVGKENDSARLWGERREGLRHPGVTGAQRGRHVLGHGCSNSSQGAELSSDFLALLWGD